MFSVNFRATLWPNLLADFLGFSPKKSTINIYPIFARVIFILFYLSKYFFYILLKKCIYKNLARHKNKIKNVENKIKYKKNGRNHYFCRDHFYRPWKKN